MQLTCSLKAFRIWLQNRVDICDFWLTLLFSNVYCGESILLVSFTTESHDSAYYLQRRLVIQIIVDKTLHIVHSVESILPVLFKMSKIWVV
jgi:hypothetical protein